VGQIVLDWRRSWSGPYCCAAERNWAYATAWVKPRFELDRREAVFLIQDLRANVALEGSALPTVKPTEGAACCQLSSSTLTTCMVPGHVQEIYSYTPTQYPRKEKYCKLEARLDTGLEGS
jgi:hypothetical protein